MDEEIQVLRSRHMKENQAQSARDKTHFFSRWDPKSVWCLHWDHAPIISNAAVALLSVAGSEAAVERTFSAQGAVHTKKRNRLLDDIVEQEMFIKFNTAALQKQPGDQPRQAGIYVELTEDWEEPDDIPSVVGLFMRARRSEDESPDSEDAKDGDEQLESAAALSGDDGDEKLEEDHGKDEKRDDGDEKLDEDHGKEEKREDRAAKPVIRRLPQSAPSLDEVQRFIAQFVKDNDIHARFRWREYHLARLAQAGQQNEPPMRDTEVVLRNKIMAYVRNEKPTGERDVSALADVVS